LPVAVPSNKLDAAFARRGARLVCYLPVGDPRLAFDFTALYADCGVDIVELGMPARRPFADGPLIAGSMRRAFDAGSSFEAPWRAGDTPPDGLAFVAMTYPEFDWQKFLASPHGWHVDGFLMVGFHDQPDARDMIRQLHANNIHVIDFLAADFGDDDITRLAGGTSYIMLQAAAGLTGPRPSLDEDNARKIARLRQAGIHRPVLLGFGISTAAQARRAIELGADGVIIGSACIAHALEGAPSLATFVGEIREALDD
jgi:tryptophan synthase alpha chain